MKTVMKKMCSLLLVAVLLVSAVPTAFAAETVLCPNGHDTTEYVAELSAASCTADRQDVYKCTTAECTAGEFNVTVPNTMLAHTPGAAATCTAAQVCTVCAAELAPALGHDYADATCTAPKTCKVCGATEGEALGHDYADATCTAPKTCKICGATERTTLPHNFGHGTVCLDCGYCKHCGLTITGIVTHPSSCPNSVNYKTVCDKCNVEYITANGHPSCAVCKGCHTTETCPYCATCYAAGDKNVTSHKASDHCSECGVVNGHKADCSKMYPDTGNAQLYVWANLIVGESEKETILLDTITGLSGNDLIYQVVARNESRLRAKIPNGFSWTGHVYYEQDPKTVLTVGSTMTVTDDDDVVINLYSDEKLVVARVHTGKYYTVDRVVDVGGFQIGDTVTSADVLKAVKKFYNVSTMKMYTPGDWETIVLGGSASTLPNFVVVRGDNIVDVYVTGSRVTSSGTTYTPDSSNPKTGDMIFVPTAVLGLSLSALAVLFFLNKKRAY